MTIIMRCSCGSAQRAITTSWVQIRPVTFVARHSLSPLHDSRRPLLPYREKQKCPKEIIEKKINYTVHLRMAWCGLRFSPKYSTNCPDLRSVGFDKGVETLPFSLCHHSTWFTSCNPFQYKCVFVEKLTIHWCLVLFWGSKYFLLKKSWLKYAPFLSTSSFDISFLVIYFISLIVIYMKKT